MNINALLYRASYSLVECARLVSKIDEEYAQKLLDKAQEYRNKIIIDEELEKEVDEFEKQIRKGIKESTK